MIQIIKDFNIRDFLAVFSLTILFFLFMLSTAHAGTTTIKIFSEAGDGRITSSPYPGTWADQHDDTVGRGADYTGGEVKVSSGAFNHNTGYLGIVKAYTAFDTSVIPDNATIVDASLNIYVTGTEDYYNDQYSYISVLEGFQSSVSTLSNSDINDCGDAESNPTKGSSNVDITNISTNQYESIDLNATGLGWISKSDYTKLCLREGHDIENIAVTSNPSSGTWEQSLVLFKPSEASGTSTDPYLEVTYVTPPTTVKIYSEAGDGRITSSPYPGTWADQHDDTVGRGVDYTGDEAKVSSGAFNHNTGYQGIVKGYTAFDTSIIPDDATILSANLNLYVTGVLDDYNNQYSYITVLEGLQSSVSSLSNSDINDCGDATTNPTKGSGDVDVTDISTNQYESIDLNATGLGWVSKTGYTKLCLREGHDIENVAVTSDPYSGTWDQSGILFKTSEAAGISMDPYLEVTYD